MVITSRWDPKQSPDLPLTDRMTNIWIVSDLYDMADAYIMDAVEDQIEYRNTYILTETEHYQYLHHLKDVTDINPNLKKQINIDHCPN